MYINDIVLDIGSNIRLFADDTSVYIVVDDPVTAAACINADLGRNLHPPIFMQNVQITEVNSHKHLGIVFSQDCSWHKHINYISGKAWTRINIMRKLKFQLDRKSLETIYIVFIRPLLEYGDVIWDNCTQYEKRELDKIQNEAARIVTGATKLVSLNTLYYEIRWETLEQRRKNHRYIFSIK